LVAGLCLDTPNDRIVFFFQLSVSSLGFYQRAALFFQALFEITNLLPKTNRHSGRCWSNRIAQLNFGLGGPGVWLSRFPQLGHLLNLATSAVKRVDDESFAIDFAESNKFLESAQRCRAVIMLARELDQPVHPELGEHRRFHPGLPVVGKRIVRCDLGRRGPTRDLIKTHRAKGASIFVLAQKPTLIHEPGIILLAMANWWRPVTHLG